MDVVAADTLAELDARVRASLLEGASSLVAVTESVLRAVPREAHYAVAGHVAQSVARAARVRCGRERPWTTAADRLEIQDWSISKEGDPS